jgi:signal transduction histidine kinase
LERRIEERTAELERSNAELRLAMDHLVTTEKQASLGRLVAGVAHELNTPLGNLLTVATSHEARVAGFAEKASHGPMLKSVFEEFLTDSLAATRMLARSAERAAEMISNFKQVAVDQSSLRRRRFDLLTIVQETLLTLHNQLKRTPIEVEIDIPEGIVLDNFPGPIEQILTNFINNSLLHAFEPDQPGRLVIRGRVKGNHLHLTYEDNGRGMSEDVAKRAFDPFFTTKFGQGGSGLGLNIVYNLATGLLNGNVRLFTKPGKGTRFELDFPMVAPDLT